MDQCRPKVVVLVSWSSDDRAACRPSLIDEWSILTLKKAWRHELAILAQAMRRWTRGTTIVRLYIVGAGLIVPAIVLFRQRRRCFVSRTLLINNEHVLLIEFTIKGHCA